MLLERWLTSSFEDRDSALISRRYGVPRFFILLLFWNWCSYRLEMGISGNHWIVVKDTCCIWCGMRDVYGFNEGEMCFILNWFGVHQSFLRSWGDISVLLVLWQSCWGLSRVQSSISRIAMFLIGKTQLLCMQCRGIGPHLVARGKSHGVSRVAAGTWGYILELRRGCPF